MAITSIALPTSPGLRIATPRPIDLGNWQEPAMGGTTTYLGRLGNHWALDLETPQLVPEPDGRIWSAALCEAIGRTARVAIPQPGLAIGAPGTPVVDGAGQTGTGLALRGLTVGLNIQRGRWLTLTDGNFYFAHRTIGGDIIAGSDGKATVSIWPMLRTSFANGAAVNLAAPVIEGRLIGSAAGWTMERARIRGLSFTIEEVR